MAIPIEIPAELAELLDRNPDAKARFETMAASHRREYIQWIEEAKRPATRAKRIAETVERIANPAKTRTERRLA